MKVKAKGDFGVPNPKIIDKIKPLAGRDNLKVWPKGEKGFCLIKDEEYEIPEDAEWDELFEKSGKSVSRPTKNDMERKEVSSAKI